MKDANLWKIKNLNSLFSTIIHIECKLLITEGL